MKRNILAAGALIAAPLLLPACGNATATPATEPATATIYPPLPDDPESLLECDKGAPVISAIPGCITGEVAKPNTPVDAARQFASSSIRPEFGTQFEVAAMGEKGDLAVLTLATAKTIQGSVSEGSVASVVSVYAQTPTTGLLPERLRARSTLAVTSEGPGGTDRSAHDGPRNDACPICQRSHFWRR